MKSESGQILGARYSTTNCWQIDIQYLSICKIYTYTQLDNIKTVINLQVWWSSWWSFVYICYFFHTKQVNKFLPIYQTLFLHCSNAHYQCGSVTKLLVNAQHTTVAECYSHRTNNYLKWRQRLQSLKISCIVRIPIHRTRYISRLIKTCISCIYLFCTIVCSTVIVLVWQWRLVLVHITPVWLWKFSLAPTWLQVWKLCCHCWCFCQSVSW